MEFWQPVDIGAMTVLALLTKDNDVVLVPIGALQVTYGVVRGMPRLSGLYYGNTTFLLSRKPKRSSREGYLGSLPLSLLHGDKEFGAKCPTVKVPVCGRCA